MRMSLAVLALGALTSWACGDDGGGTIEGTVSVEGDTPEGLVMELHPMEGDDETDIAAAEENDPLAEAETDSDGAYSLGGVEDGEYMVIADVGDLSTAPSCIIIQLTTIEDAATETVDFEVPEGYQPTGPISLLLDGGFLACG
jgi:hypothetical protein